MACGSDPMECEARLKAEVKRQKNELDRLTRLLCSLCKKIESKSLKNLIDESGELRIWWEDHKRVDAERETREAEERKKAERTKALKQEALSKLTEDEKKALGLNK